MVSDTRSSRKTKDEVDGNRLKSKVDNGKDTSKYTSGKADSPGVRRSTRETVFSGQTTPSPRNTRKSKRFEKETPSSTPPGTRKSERLEKNNTPSPLRRSDRGKKHTSPSLSLGKKSLKEHSFSEAKRKKEKNLIEIVMESEKVALHLESVGEKRKKMSARTFKTLFKRQCIQDTTLDVDMKPEASRKLSMYSNLMGYVPLMPLDGNPSTSTNIEETFYDSEKRPTICSSVKDIDVTATESSTCLARLQDGAVSPERCRLPKDAVSTQPSLVIETNSFLWNCVRCSKNRRISYDSPEKELCTCSTVDEDHESTSSCEDRVNNGVSVTLQSTGNCEGGSRSEEAHSDHEMDGRENACTACNKDGELLCCEGKGCKKRYHFCCLDPPLTDILPGVWHCPLCVKKKIESGVHSVSEGVESIWDVREVKVSNVEGAKQRQYLVKYHGLAHIHNHWVPEKHLLLENPCLVSKFKERILRWRAEWAVPHRILWRRCIKHRFSEAPSSNNMVCNNEWLVKWRGLDYDHATWELDNSLFLNTSLGQNLMKDYETRRAKAKKELDKFLKGPDTKLSDLPVPGGCLNASFLLKNVNKLRDFWFKGHNAIVFDHQDPAVTMVFFIRSLAETCQPFLIVAPSDSISQWESEFVRLAPSIDCVVYCGSREIRKGIRASEFYDEGGSLMLQVLLCSPKTVLEDAEILKRIKWQVIVIDSIHHAGIPDDIEQIKILNTDLKILLFRGQIKDTSEYLNMLSLLESPADFDKLRGLRNETKDNLVKLKGRLSRFVAYGSIYEASRFHEYWVPVQMSNHQLEQYCATLVSNSMALCSCSTKDPIGALRDVLYTVRKCCDHPYLVDSSMQERLIAEGCPAAELLDIGVKASGKLQLLDFMLTEIKARGLQVLILFQSIRGAAGMSTGDILEDFLRQRFGQAAYERVESGVSPPKKQTAVNRFNKKETGQFVFLLENRACSPSIKLLSLDVILMYDSDWNPSSDLRALQKLTVDSKVEQIKVFRLYSFCTIEEKALLLAKQNLNLDNNLQNLSRAVSNTLLMWGASHLFSKLEKYHSESTSAVDISPAQFLLNEVVKEFQSIINSESCENGESYSVISKAKLDDGRYITHLPMHGEAKVKLKEGEEPHVFWKNLLDNKNPHWKLLKEPCPRNRKRIHYFEGSPNKTDENNDVGKKRRKLMDPVALPVEFVDGGTQAAGSEQEPPMVRACNRSQTLRDDSVTSNSNANCMVGHSSLCLEVEVAGSEEKLASSDDQNNLYSFLQKETLKLCQTLELSDDVTNKVSSFLDYVIKNHSVNSNSPAILQAFQISLCWTAASLSNQKVDKKESLMSAKRLLNYQCTEEQASYVYSRMRELKKLYFPCPEKTVISGRDCLSAEDDICKIPSSINEKRSRFSSFELQKVKIEMEENLACKESAEVEIHLQQKLMQKNKGSGSDNTLEQIQKKCVKRMKKLLRKQREEIQEFHRIWEKKRLDLETDHNLEKKFIRTILAEGSTRMNRLKFLDDVFAKNLEEHNLMKDAKLEDLMAEQLAAQNMEKQKASHWLAEAKSRSGEFRNAHRQESVSSQFENDVGCPQVTTDMTFGIGDVVPVHLENQHRSNNACEKGNDDVALPQSSVSAPDQGVVRGSPTEVTVNSQNVVVVTSLDRWSSGVEKSNQIKHPNDAVEVCADEEQVSDKIQSVELNSKMLATGLNKIVDQSSDRVCDTEDAICASQTVMNQPDKREDTSGLPSTGRMRESSEKTGLQFQQVPPEQLVQDTVEVADQNASLIEAAEAELVDTVSAVGFNNEPQDREAPVVESEHTVSNLQIEVSTTEIVDTVNIVQSITQPQEQDAQAVEKHCTSRNDVAILEHVDYETPVGHNTEAPAETSEQPSTFLNVSPNCDEAPTCQVGDQNNDASSQTADAEMTEVLSHESQSGENVEIESNQHNSELVNGAAQDQNFDLPVSSLNVAMPQMPDTTAEQPNQSGSQLERNAGSFPRSSYSHFHHIQQAGSSNLSPPLSAEPLQNEVERMKKEAEQLEKCRGDMMAQLKSDCEKEIAQIRQKYEVKLQSVEVEFRMKKNELDKNQYRVVMNKILAEAFRSKCLDRNPVPQQGTPSSFLQHMHQVSMQPAVRPTPGPSAHRPPAGQQNADPAVAAIQQLPLPHLTRPALVSSPNIVGPSAQRATNPISGTSSRPPVISAITPAGNPRMGTEIRSRAPHLQSFRPAVASSSVPPATLPPISQHLSQQLAPLKPSSTSQDRPELHSGQPSQLKLSLSAVDLLINMDNRSSGARNHNTLPLPEIRSTFGLLEPSDLERLGNAQANPASAADTDVVCLSDDDE